MGEDLAKAQHNAVDEWNSQVDKNTGCDGQDGDLALNNNRLVITQTFRLIRPLRGMGTHYFLNFENVSRLVAGADSDYIFDL